MDPDLIMTNSSSSHLLLRTLIYLQLHRCLSSGCLALSTRLQLKWPKIRGGRVTCDWRAQVWRATAALPPRPDRLSPPSCIIPILIFCFSLIIIKRRKNYVLTIFLDKGVKLMYNIWVSIIFSNSFNNEQSAWLRIMFISIKSKIREL